MHTACRILHPGLYRVNNWSSRCLKKSLKAEHPHP